jgi:hypothetical protein
VKQGAERCAVEVRIDTPCDFRRARRIFGAAQQSKGGGQERHAPTVGVRFVNAVAPFQDAHSIGHTASENIGKAEAEILVTRTHRTIARGVFEGADCPLAVASQDEDLAQGGQGFVIARVEGDGLFELSERLFVVAGTCERAS